MHNDKDAGSTTVANYRGHAISINSMGVDGQGWLAHFSVSLNGEQLASVTLDGEFASASEALTAAQLQALAFVDRLPPRAA